MAAAAASKGGVRTGFDEIAASIASPAACRREADAYARCATAQLPGLPEPGQCSIEVRE